MTEDLGQIHDARENDRDASDSDTLVGGQDAAILIGQAAISVAQPAPGQGLTIEAEAGQRYVIEFSPDAAQVRVQGNDLILRFADGGSVTFRNLGAADVQADAPVFEIAGQPISSAAIFGQAVALAGGEEAPTFETAAGPTGPQGTGETRYDDDTGELIDLIDPQGVIPGTELAFRLIDLEPTTVLGGVETNPPVDFDVDVTANFVESLEAAGLTFADGVGFGGGGGGSGSTEVSLIGFETDLGAELTDLTGEDDEETLVDLSFAFPFQGGTFTTIGVSTNGFVVLSGDIDDADHTCCPDLDDLLDADVPLIAPFWSDLDLDEMGTVRVNDFGDRVVITWDGVGSYQEEEAPFTFQLQLFADGRIAFSYNGITDILALDEDLIVGISPGVATDPGESDFSTGVTSTPVGTIYEVFEEDSELFDLNGQTIVFTPNASGGWDAVTTIGFPVGDITFLDTFEDLSNFDVVPGGFATTVGDIGSGLPGAPSQGLLIAGGIDGAEGDGAPVEDIEAFFGLVPGTLEDIALDDNPDTDDDPTDGSAIKTTVTVAAGDVLSFRFNFLEDEGNLDDDGEFDINNFNDFAFVVVGDQVFKLSDVTSANQFSNADAGVAEWEEESGYLTFNFTFATAGTFQVGVGVMNVSDESVDPGLLIDNFTITSGTVTPGELPGGFLYEFQVGEAEIVADNIHGTDVEDGVTTQFTITSLPTGPDGSPVGFLLIDRGDDSVIEEIVGPGFGGVPITVQTGDSVFYFLPKSDFADRPDVVTFNYFTTDTDGLNSLGDGPATVTINLPDPVPTVTATDASVDEDDIVPLEDEESSVASAFSAALVSSFGQQPGSDTLDLGLPFDQIGSEDTIVTGTISANFDFDNPGTIGFTQATIDALNALGLTSSTNDLPLEYAVGFDGLALLATAGDEVVFAVAILPPSSSGDFVYGFGLFGSINHPLTDDPATGDFETRFEDPSVLPIVFEVTDLNGDTATGTFNVTVVDDVPTIGFEDGPYAYSISEEGGNFYTDFVSFNNVSQNSDDPQLWRTDLRTGNSEFVASLDGAEGAADYEGLTFGNGAQSGFLFAYDEGTDRIVKIDPSTGAIIEIWTEGPESADLEDVGLTVNSEGRFFVLDQDQGIFEVQFNEDGTFDLSPVTDISTEANTGFDIASLAADPTDSSLLYALGIEDDTGLAKLFVIDLDASGGPTIDPLPGTVSFSNDLGSGQYGLHFAPDGTLWGLFERDTTVSDGESVLFRIDLETGNSVDSSVILMPSGLGGFESLAINDPGALKLWESEIDQDGFEGGEGTSKSVDLRIVFGADGPASDTDAAPALALNLVGVRALADGPGDAASDPEFAYDTDGSTTNPPLTSGGETVTVAADPDDPTVIYGFIDGGEGNGVFDEGDILVFRGSVDVDPFDSSDPRDAEFTFELFRPLDHPDADDPATPDINESEYTTTISETVGGLDNIRFEFGVTVTDDDGDSDSIPITVDVDDDGPRVFSTQTRVDEDGLPAREPGFDNAGVAGGPNDATIPNTDLDNNEATSSGVLNAFFGADGPGDIDFAGLDGRDATAISVSNGLTEIDLTSRGEQVVFQWDAETHILSGVVDPGGEGEREVFRLELTDLGTREDGSTFAKSGAFAFTLLDQVDHPIPAILEPGAAPSFEDNLELQLAYTITDFDGDTQTNVLRVDIDDDSPRVGQQQAPILVDEDGLQPDGIAGGPGDVLVPDTDLDGNEATNAGTLDYDFGADGPGDVAFGTDVIVNGQATTDPITPTSRGETVTFVYDADTRTLTGVANEGTAEARDVIRIQVTDIATGDYTVALLDQLDHPVSSTEDNLQLTIPFTVTDFDGDAASGTLIVDIDDDSPKQILETVETTPVEEEHNPVPGGNEDTDATPDLDGDTSIPNRDGPPTTDFDVTTNVSTGSLAAVVSFGADQPGAFGLSSETGDLPSLTSLGDAVLYSVTGNLLTGYVESGAADGLDGDDREVFTLELSGERNATYTFTLIGPLDHHPVDLADDVEGNLSLDFSSVVAATDFDGDSILLDPETFMIQVIDDVPVLTDGTATVVHDETPGVDDDADDVDFNGTDPTVPDMLLPPAIADLGLTPIGAAQSAAGQVDYSFGADGPGQVSLTDSNGDPLGGVDSGLVRTSDGAPIFLFTDPDDPALVLGWAASGDPISFDTGDVDGDAAAETIAVPAHGLSTGQKVIYSFAGSGITNAGVFFAIVLDANTIQLAATEADALAGTAVDLTPPPADADALHSIVPVSDISLAVYLDTNGEGSGDDTLWVAQFDAIRHPLEGDGTDPEGSHDESVGIENKIFLTVADGDGDSVTAQDALTIEIQDDGPSVASFEMINDETPGLGDATPSDDIDLDDFEDAFDDGDLPEDLEDILYYVGEEPINVSMKPIEFKYGADGPGGIALNDVVDGTDSNLVDTATGRSIFLFNGPGDTVVGVVLPEDVDPEDSGDLADWIGSVVEAIDDGFDLEELDVAFAAALGDPADPTGLDNASSADLWFVQYRAIQHDNPLDPDEANDEPASVQGPPDVITFEGLKAGTWADTADDGPDVFKVFAAEGSGPILVSAINAGVAGNAAVIFDSANPSDGLFGLGTPNEDFGGPGVGPAGEDGGPFPNDTPLGKTLIVGRVGTLVDGDGDGLVDVPRVQGLTTTTLVFDFSAVGPVRLDSITALDVGGRVNPNDPGSGPQSITFNLFDADGLLIDSIDATMSGETAGDNGVEVVDLGGTSGVVRMEAVIVGSGAVDNIVFQPDPLPLEDEFLNLTYTVTDGDLDTVQGTAKITIEDDGPTAVDDAPVYIDGGEGGSASGNVLGNGDDPGADGAAGGGAPMLNSFTFTGENEFGEAVDMTVAPGTTVTTFAGGELTVEANGDWVYASGSGDGISAAGYVDDFSYVIEDGDGDTDSAIQPIRVVLEPEALSLNAPAGDVLGGINDDFLAGSDAVNTIVGNAGNDLLFGGGGDDTLVAGTGNDQLFGDGGADAFAFSLSGPEGTNIIGDFSGLGGEGDTLEFNDVVDVPGTTTGIDIDDVVSSFSKTGSTVTVDLQSGTTLIIEDMNNVLNSVGDLDDNSLINGV